MARLVVATHNVMHGVRLPGLLPAYGALRSQQGLDLLCLQEHAHEGDCFGEAIAASLGRAYRALWSASFPRLGVVYDGTRLAVADTALLPLPRLERLAFYERFYIRGGKTRQKYAQVVRFRLRGGGGTSRGATPGEAALLTVVNVHLDTAGGNAHRAGQMAAAVSGVIGRGWTDRLVLCGDTNAFAWGRRRQAAALAEILDPVHRLGAETPGSAATHFFGRQREPRLSHRLCVAAGRLGLDLPLRYDVVASTLPVRAHGQVHTPDSDHDLVWAALAI